MNYENITNEQIQAFISKFSNSVVKKVRRFRKTRQFCVSFRNNITDHGVLWVNHYDDMICLGIHKHSNNFPMSWDEFDEFTKAFAESVEAIAKLEDMGLDCATEIVAYGLLTIVGDSFYGVNPRNKDYAYLINRTEGNKCTRHG